jgi:hypothetical protein
MAKAHYGLALAYQELGMHESLLQEYRVLETLDKSLAKKLVVTFPRFNFSCRLLRGCPYKILRSSNAEQPFCGFDRTPE